MRALCIMGSPNPSSLLHAMAAAAGEVLTERGYTLDVHDLYAEQFQPVQPTGELGNTRSDDALVETHGAQLQAADLILVFHPNWWGQPPAIVKGWVDRVFRVGTAYGYPPGVSPDGVPTELLRARAALVINTSNTPAVREAAVFGDPLETLWKRCIFALCGVAHVERRMYGPMGGSGESERRAWIAAVADLVAQVAFRAAPVNRTVALRAFQSRDAARLLAVYTSAIHRVASKDYSPEQIRAWAPVDFDPALWRAKMEAIAPVVAVLDGTPVGYADLQPNGYIDHFFVSGDHPRQGIGTCLMRRLLADAHARGMRELTSHVSRTAQPFFERFGFVVTAQRSPVVRGVVVPNAAMHRRVE